ncbi:hypothetical protein JHD49_02825 [Sulfurimonas sp. SAG-AH-194-C21]|nr:hypothetical protein [Sulfurimonas sp. SAG-AH-194-C21]MDF1882868.1 hypothetical protein [Sulfurimonas sp. SAG-AH-194-C21]
MKLILLHFFIFLGTSLIADKIYVIANEDIQTSRDELKRFFSAKSDYINGQKFKRISNAEALESLAELAFSINEKKLSKKWIKQNFRKGTPFPTSLKNNEKTIEWVKNHKKTIGFVDTKPKNIVVIYTFGK